MLTKEQFLLSISQEFDTCKHLFSKLPDGYDFNYRPNENMRSTLELLQYITYAPYEFAVAMICTDAKSKWKSYTEAEERSILMKPEEFPAALDAQIEKFRIMFEGLNEVDLASRAVKPDWSKSTALGANIIDMSLKTAVAYRMQFFLYLKMTVLPELHSGDCWYNAE